MSHCSRCKKKSITLVKCVECYEDKCSGCELNITSRQVEQVLTKFKGFVCKECGQRPAGTPAMAYAGGLSDGEEITILSERIDNLY